MRAGFFFLIAAALGVAALAGVGVFMAIGILVIGGAVLGVILTEPARRANRSSIHITTHGPSQIDISIGDQLSPGHHRAGPGTLGHPPNCEHMIPRYSQQDPWIEALQEAPFEPGREFRAIYSSNGRYVGKVPTSGPVEAIIPFERVMRAWESRYPPSGASAQELIAWAEGRAEIEDAKQRQIDE